jgi:hypothetical protein
MKKFEISQETHDAIVDAARSSTASSQEEEERFLIDLHDPNQSGPTVNTLSFFVAVRRRIEKAGGLPKNEPSEHKEDTVQD